MHAWILALCLSLAHGSDYTEVQPGTQYTSETRVGMASLGLSFVVPDDWFGALSPDGAAFVLASRTRPGMVLVTGDVDQTMDTARQTLSTPLPIDAFTVARPQAEPEASGHTLTQRYTVQTGDDPVSGFGVAYVSKAGGGLLMIAFGPEPGPAEALARKLLASVEEHAMPAAPTVTPPAKGALADGLKGRQLLYMKTANGFSDEEHVYLCSNGQAAIRSSSSAVSFGGAGTGTYAGTSGNDGTWTLQGNQVVVNTPNGTRTWNVRIRDDGSVGIDRDNWWVRPQDQCP